MDCISAACCFERKARRDGKNINFTYEVNPGEVWEEDEFWIELSWKIDKHNDLGIRKHFASPYRKGEKLILMNIINIFLKIRKGCWKSG